MANLLNSAALVPYVAQRSSKIGALLGAIPKAKRWQALALLASMVGVSIVKEAFFNSQSEERQREIGNALLEQVRTEIERKSPDQAVNLLADAEQKLTVLADGNDLNPSIDAAARRSATLHTGDGAQTDVRTLEASMATVDGAVAVLRRGMAALRLYNAEELQAVRDVMFLDQEIFELALARIRR